MNKSRAAGIFVAGLTIALIAFLVDLFLIKILWAWTVPDLFPGAVEQGLVAKSISWFTAAKIALLIAILSGIAGSRRTHGRV